MIEVADKFNMVDMGGIDILKSQGTAVDGLFNLLLSAIQRCRYSLLYNWYFAEVSIAPSPVELVFDSEKVIINELISITSDDVIHVDSMEIPPVIRPLSVGENGIFNPPDGVDGFSPVNVNVPQPPPVVQSLSVTENGVYEAPQGVDGFNPVTVNVPTGSEYFLRLPPVEYDFNNGGYISFGTWYATGGSGTKTDIYQVEANKRYIVLLGEFVGNRFRVAFFNENPADATGNLYGTQIIGTDSPAPYASSPVYSAQTNGYIAVAKCNNNISGISTYAFEIADLA